MKAFEKDNDPEALHLAQAAGKIRRDFLTTKTRNLRDLLPVIVRLEVSRLH